MAATYLIATDRQHTPLAGVGFPSRGYTVYGAMSHGSGPALGFTGQLGEEQLGWYMLGNGHRAYNPVLMRFHSSDALSPFGKGGLNAYAYCQGDPVNHHDPNGRFMHLIDGLLNFIAYGGSVVSAAIGWYQFRGGSTTGLGKATATAAALTGALGAGGGVAQALGFSMADNLLRGATIGSAVTVGLGITNQIRSKGNGGVADAYTGTGFGFVWNRPLSINRRGSTPPLPPRVRLETFNSLQDGDPLSPTGSSQATSPILRFIDEASDVRDGQQVERP